MQIQDDDNDAALMSHAALPAKNFGRQKQVQLAKQLGRYTKKQVVYQPAVCQTSMLTAFAQLAIESLLAAF